MESYKTMLARAKQANACKEALIELEQFTSFDDFVKNCKNAPEYLYWYAQNVLHKRWPEAEELIYKSEHSEWYRRAFNI